MLSKYSPSNPFHTPNNKQSAKKTDPKKRKPPNRANCYCCHLDSLETLTKPKSQEPIASSQKKKRLIDQRHSKKDPTIQSSPIPTHQSNSSTLLSPPGPTPSQSAHSHSPSRSGISSRIFPSSSTPSSGCTSTLAATAALSTRLEIGSW
jgi:hypothetical protein